MKASSILTRWERIASVVRSQACVVSADKIFFAMLYAAREGHLTALEARRHFKLGDETTRQILNLLCGSGLLFRTRLERKPGNHGPAPFIWHATPELYAVLAVKPEDHNAHVQPS